MFQASETRMALDGVTWPQSNPKTLRVTFGTKVLISTSNKTFYQGFSPFQCQEEMKKLAEGGDDPGVVGRLGVELEGRSLLRDWDRNKVIMGYDISVCLKVLCPCLASYPF